MRTADDDEPGRLFLGCSYALGVFLGIGLGVYGAFTVPAGPRIGGTLLSVGVAIAVIGNAGAAVGVRWLTGTRTGAVILLLGWVPVVLWLGTSRPEGDLVLQGNTTGYLFIVLGAIAPIVVAVTGPARRGLTALPPRA